MPDFERITDQLRIDVCNDENEKHYWNGYRKGKTAARLQVLYIAISIYFLIAFYGWYMT